MPVSEKKKISNRKWDRKNLRTVMCRVYKEDADELRKIAESQGKTVSALMLEEVSKMLGRPLTKRTKHEGSDTDDEPE